MNEEGVASGSAAGTYPPLLAANMTCCPRSAAGPGTPLGVSIRGRPLRDCIRARGSDEVGVGLVVSCAPSSLAKERLEESVGVARSVGCADLSPTAEGRYAPGPVDGSSSGASTSVSRRKHWCGWHWCFRTAPIRTHERCACFALSAVARSHAVKAVGDVSAWP